MDSGEKCGSTLIARENADDEWIPFPLNIKLRRFSPPKIASSATAAARLSVSGPHCATLALLATYSFYHYQLLTVNLVYVLEGASSDSLLKEGEKKPELVSYRNKRLR